MKPCAQNDQIRMTSLKIIDWPLAGQTGGSRALDAGRAIRHQIWRHAEAPAMTPQMHEFIGDAVFACG
jgi:hypothetical protein